MKCFALTAAFSLAVLLQFQSAKADEQTVTAHTQMMLDMGQSSPINQMTHGGLSSLLAPLPSDKEAFTVLRSVPLTNLNAFFSKFFLIFPGHPLDVSRAMESYFTDPNGPLGAKDSENTGIPSFYTFIGQFIDHDLTKNVLGLLDPTQGDGIANNRSPLLDLDSMYGSLPYFDSAGGNAIYEDFKGDKAGRFILGGSDATVGFDVLRDANGVAVIPDGRNDENEIISQIHVLFQKFHNKVVADLAGGGKADLITFEAARREVLFNYQSAILQDYLPRIIGQTLVDDIVKNGPKFSVCSGNFNRDDDNIRISHEFGGATFRLGHSQIRPGYALNDTSSFPIFTTDKNTDDLRGNRPLLASKVIKWSKFLPIGGSAEHSFSLLINSKISKPLFNLPVEALPDTKSITSLPERNVVRGAALGLASGEYVAGKMGETVLTKAELGLPDAFSSGTPLWFYILKEAEIRTGGAMLGPVGGRLVGETLIGDLQCDQNSVINNPSWKSRLPTETAGKITFSDIVAYATK